MHVSSRSPLISWYDPCQSSQRQMIHKLQSSCLALKSAWCVLTPEHRHLKRNQILNNNRQGTGPLLLTSLIPRKCVQNSIKAKASEIGPKSINTKWPGDDCVHLNPAWLWALHSWPSLWGLKVFLNLMCLSGIIGDLQIPSWSPKWQNLPHADSHYINPFWASAKTPEGSVLFSLEDNNTSNHKWHFIYHSCFDWKLRVCYSFELDKWMNVFINPT